MSWSERYWAKVQKGSGCWRWTSTLDKDGYGVLTVDSRKRKAHRLALELRGVDVQGKVVRHSCDNPPCVNPDHLLVGSQQDNVNDKVLRNRNPSKLSSEQVKEIRAKYGAGGVTLEALGKAYGVTFQHISAVFHRIKRGSV